MPNHNHSLSTHTWTNIYFESDTRIPRSCQNLMTAKSHLSIGAKMRSGILVRGAHPEFRQNHNFWRPGYDGEMRCTLINKRLPRRTRLKFWRKLWFWTILGPYYDAEMRCKRINYHLPRGRARNFDENYDFERFWTPAMMPRYGVNR